MKRFIDSKFPTDLQAAHKFELDIHECVEQYSDKSTRDRLIYIDALEYLDAKIDGLFSESELLNKAYSYLRDTETCSDHKFWQTGLTRLKQIRSELWDKLLHGTHN